MLKNEQSRENWHPRRFWCFSQIADVAAKPLPNSMRKGNQFLQEGWDSLMNKSGLLCWINWFHIKSGCFHIQCDSLQVREKSIKQNQGTEAILKMHTQPLQVLILYGITIWRRLENLMAAGKRGLFKSFFFFFLKEDLMFTSLILTELHFLGPCYMLIWRKNIHTRFLRAKNP